MKTKKMLCAVVMVMMLAIMFTVPAFAAGTGDVAGAIEGTWTDASAQIKTVVNNVVFPVIDLVLAVFFFAKLGMAYFDYRKHGQFEWTAPAILFACLMIPRRESGSSIGAKKRVGVKSKYSMMLNSSRREGIEIPLVMLLM